MGGTSPPFTENSAKIINGKKNWKEKRKEKTDENSGHYVIASSRPPERQPLERRTLAPKMGNKPALFGEYIHLVSTGQVRNVQVKEGQDRAGKWDV